LEEAMDLSRDRLILELEPHLDHDPSPVWHTDPLPPPPPPSRHPKWSNVCTPGSWTPCKPAVMEHYDDFIVNCAVKRCGRYLAVDRCKYKRGNWITLWSTVFVIYINYTGAHTESRVAETGKCCNQPLIVYCYLENMSGKWAHRTRHVGFSRRRLWTLLSSGMWRRVSALDFCGFCVCWNVCSL
jgi:hypothetical protein